MREKVYIFLDDERDTLYEMNADFMRGKGHTCYHCRTAETAMKLLDKFKNIADFIVDFDHDLGLEGTGYDVAKYIVEKELPVKGFYIHSMYVVGRQNIYDLLTHYGYSCIGME